MYGMRYIDFAGINSKILSEQSNNDEVIRQYQFDNKDIGAKINDILRSGRPLKRIEKRFVSELDSVIKRKGKPITKIVYRGIDGNTDFGKSIIGNLNSGYKINNAGYLSTTPHESAAKSIALYSQIPIYFIINPNGSVGLDLTGSGEVLFGRNSVLTVVSFKHEEIDNDDTDQLGSGYIITCNLSFK